MSDTIHLRIKKGHGKALLEPLPAEFLHGGAYLLLASPNFVYGIAAGDELEVEQHSGDFLVLARGGNLALRVFAETALGAAFDELAEAVAARLDGRLDSRLPQSAVFTLPVAAGFDEIEALFNDYVSEQAGAVWEYGNVYDDDGESLDWWL